MGSESNMPPATVGIYPEATKYIAPEAQSLEIKLDLVNQSASGDFIKLSVENVPQTWVTILPSQFIFLDRGKAEKVTLDLLPPPNSAGCYELSIIATRRNGLELVGQTSILVTVLKSETSAEQQSGAVLGKRSDQTSSQKVLSESYQVSPHFEVKLDATHIYLAPGDEHILDVQVTNQEVENDTFRIDLESNQFPSSWVSIDPARIEINRGQQQTFRVRIRPPRKPTSTAKPYPFTLKVESRRRPDQPVRIACLLTVKTYHKVLVQVAPCQVFSDQPVRVTVNNAGNAPATVEVSWQYHEQSELNFEVLPTPPVLVTPGSPTQAVAVTQTHSASQAGHSLLRVDAGKSDTLQFKVTSKKPFLLGKPRQYSFTTKVVNNDRSEQTFPCVVTVQPLLPSWVVVGLLLLCLFSFVAVIWLLKQSADRAGNPAAAIETQVVYSLTQTIAASQTAMVVQMDSDGDGLLDSVEIGLGTNPSVVDTDIDGLSDGDEVNNYKTDPTIADGDQDGLVDGDEIVRGTDPHAADTDGDKLKDADEVRLGTDPTSSDTDKDGLLDGDEASSCTKPLDPDTDKDGILDGEDIDPCDKQNPSLTQTAVALTPTTTRTFTPTPSLTPVSATPTFTLVPPTVTPTPVLTGLPGHLLFSSNREGHAQIYLQDMKAGGITRLTVSDGDDTLPSWSPDGRQAAFTSNRDGNQEIYIMDANGANQVNLTNHPGSDSHPTWSPDGEWIAFTTNRDGNDEIYIMRIDGSALQNITNHPASDSQPYWESMAGIESVAGTILFVSDRDGNQEIYKMSPDGLLLVNLSNHDAKDYHPVFSPSGGQIAFVSDRDGSPDIFVMDANGSNLRNLTVSSSAVDEAPTWSEDNQWIAYSTNLLGNFEIYVIKSDGSLQNNITMIQGDDRDPAWR